MSHPALRQLRIALSQDVDERIVSGVILASRLRTSSDSSGTITSSRSVSRSKRSVVDLGNLRRVSTETITPRDMASSSPSFSSCLMLVRTGMRLTPSAEAIASWLNRSPGAKTPWLIASRRKACVVS